MEGELLIHAWTASGIEAHACALDEAATIAEPALRLAAVETSFAFRCAGRALAWVDEGDTNVLIDLAERLEGLRADADRILRAIAARVETSSEDEKTVIRRFAPPPAPSDEPTLVRGTRAGRRSGLWPSQRP